MSSLKNLNTIYSVISPYNDKDMQLLSNFCLKSSCDLYEKLKKIKNTYTEEQYKFQKEYDIVTEDYYFTENNNEIVNLVKVEVIKDRKTAKIDIYKVDSNKKFIPDFCRYLIMVYGFEDVFVFVKREDIQTINSLLENNFISLASSLDDEECIAFLLEKVHEKESSRHI